MKNLRQELRTCVFNAFSDFFKHLQTSLERNLCDVKNLRQEMRTCVFNAFQEGRKKRNTGYSAW